MGRLVGIVQGFVQTKMGYLGSILRKLMPDANASIPDAHTKASRNKQDTWTGRLQTKNAEQNDLAIRAVRTGGLREYHYRPAGTQWPATAWLIPLPMLVARSIALL
jgi:hypothetical protein